MTKGFSTGCLIAVLMELLFVSSTAAQTEPTLQITNSNGNISLTWSNSKSFFALEATTNLSRPDLWNRNIASIGHAGNINIPAVQSQEFFRLSPLIPIFQFAIFYNINMEINPGASMNIKGPVFCNASIWAKGTAPLNFLSPVSAVGFISTANTDPFSLNYIGSSNPTFSAGTNMGVGALTLFGLNTDPSPALVRSIIDLPPAGLGAPNQAAYLATNQIYNYNASDLIISNSVSGTNGSSRYRTNLTVFYQNPYRIQVLEMITNDFFIVTNRVTHVVFSTNNVVSIPNSNIVFAGFSFVTNVTFYDYRESATVQAVQLDIAKFNQWLTNTAPTGGNQWNTLNKTGATSKGRDINSIYIYNKVTLSGTQLPAVRVVSGQVLPTRWGLTISTPQPLYVKGNYNIQTNIGGPMSSSTNTLYTRPAAFMADAISVLSSNWSDAYNSATSLSSRTPGDTTINAACLQGIVPTDKTITGDYSGGVENFFRLLENWNGVAFTWNGSMAAMFPSQYATNHWKPTGNYYNAPFRYWAFDQNFLNLGKLPLLTPWVINMVSP